MPAAKLRPVGPSTTARAAGHVLAAVVADALDDRVGAGVADAEALADDPAQEELRRSSRRSAMTLPAMTFCSADERRVAVRGARRCGRRTAPCRRSRWRRRTSRIVTPAGRNAPKDCPAEPVRVSVDGVVGEPVPPCALVTWWPSIVPTVRLTLRTGDLGRAPARRRSMARQRPARAARCRAPCRGRGPAAPTVQRCRRSGCRRRRGSG